MGKPELSSRALKLCFNEDCHMETERINDANAADYAELLGEDEVKELNRLYYRGLGIRDKRGNSEAALIFRLDHLNDQDAVTEALILKLKGTPEQAGALLLTYSRLAASEDVRRTLFEAPFDEAAELEAVLMEYGFRTEEGGKAAKA
ncbi:MAG: hypothetical protein J5966_10415 [Lachnospiraceae bacterium]|nr:hypothetical protein [Lachnospiraceae bacterium]